MKVLLRTQSTFNTSVHLTSITKLKNPNISNAEERGACLCFVPGTAGSSTGAVWSALLFDGWCDDADGDGVESEGGKKVLNNESGPLSDT
jgi:hypothetical protein